MEEQKNKCKNNAPLIVIIVILLIAVLGLGGYIFLNKDNLSGTNNVAGSNNTNVKGESAQDSVKTEIDKPNENLNNSFLIVDSPRDDYPNYKSTIYLASNDYFKDGTKKELFTKNIISMSVLDNKIFYIDNTNKLYMYSVENEQTESYDLMNVEINYNTAILPGKNNVIIMLTNGKGILVNLKDKTNKIIDINNRRGKGIYDENHNILYYSTGEDIYKYDITNGQSLLIKEVKGYPTFQDDKYIYFATETNGIEQFYSLNKETTVIKALNIADYNTVVSSVASYAKIDDSLFLLFNTDDKLIEYKEDKESYILEADYIKYINIGNQLYIAKAPLVGNEILGPGDFDTFYTYDMKNSKLESSDNQFVKELFHYFAIYNLYE